jgi:Spy/CpxP family protein refolding chaperone
MKKRIIVTIMALTLVFGSYAFAQQGMGRGPGKGMKGKDGCPILQNLTNEEQQKVADERDAFLKDTETLRQQIRQKHQELKEKIAKADVDQEKAMAIQKELTDLMAQLAQKRLQHQFNLKNINPELGTCFMRAHGMKHGMGMGGPSKGTDRGKGQGMYPNCPFYNPSESESGDFL